MAVKPFLKWAGGKRWLAEREDFSVPLGINRYIEPFLGGGAIFFSAVPARAILSDVNAKLIGAYTAIRDNPLAIRELMLKHHAAHCREYYYEMRGKTLPDPIQRAGQFLYLNRACWNGLYRENLKGEFNVPIGTKTAIALDDDDFEGISAALSGADIRCCDFAETIDEAGKGDFLFIDPPYTTAHNLNGFVKYNQKIFTWDDQVRLRNCVQKAAQRGAKIVVTNADHASICDLYVDVGALSQVKRASVISGKASARQLTTELIIRCNM